MKRRESLNLNRKQEKTKKKKGISEGETSTLGKAGEKEVFSSFFLTSDFVIGLQKRRLCYDDIQEEESRKPAEILFFRV